ncbi:hypothetical protein [Photobacterium swingsii]|uniref:Uncharacterized protein n=1 Tax=Photobacterium swingsii TaxID=680026 RepID=A0A0J8Y1V4_9GAMM|nr:hypothetical protein [Photobacterium swingsii]KMV31594.1 hypothetical protein AB733_05800 [Photobacterium swingsii]PSW24857.1 hypothetical protein C9I94_08575 [Photobacterium swingsii]
MSVCKIKLTLLGISGVLFISADAFALSCNPYSAASVISSEDTLHDRRCSLVTLPEYLIDPDLLNYSDSPNWQEDHEFNGEFWDGWTGLVEDDSPVMSARAASTFYGLGFWMPDEYKEEEVDIKNIKDIQDLIRQYGLLMSFGVGGEDPDSLRFRFDYRWHETQSSDVFLQLEIPLQ